MRSIGQMARRKVRRVSPGWRAWRRFLVIYSGRALLRLLSIEELQDAAGVTR